MQRSHRRFHLGIFGGQGYGKTTYALKFIANARAACVFVFDPDGEFADELRLPACRTHFELDQAVPTGWVCFNPHIMFPGATEKGLDYFGHYSFERSMRLPGRKFFVLDECGLEQSVHDIPHYLKVLVQTGGRMAGLDGVFIAQQPNELHYSIRAALTEVVCFQLTDELALKFPKRFGFDIEAVKALPPYKFICRTRQRGEARG